MHDPSGESERNRELRHLFATCWFVALATGAASGELACDNPLVTVSSPDDALAGRICATAERAVRQLSECGMRLTEPVAIVVIEGLTPRDPRCLGLFHCENSRIEMIAPEHVEAAIDGDSYFAELPPAEFYDSVVVHELTHALAYQTRQGPLGSLTDTEYLAYAMQFQFLSDETRTEFISNHAVAEPVEPQALNEVVLAFAPGIFAIKAWKHFSQPGNGCSLVGALLSGEKTLSVGGLSP